MSTKRILITGCTGLLGETLIRKSPRNISWIGVDVRQSPICNELSKFINVDITDCDSLDEKLVEEDFDGIVHLAGFIHIDQNTPSNVDQLFDVNTKGTLNVIKLMEKRNKALFVYASSMTVYGLPVENPVEESHPLNPNSFYGLTKLMGEQIVKLYSTQKSLSTAILRFPGLFGENKEKGAIYHFCDNAASGKPIKINTQGLGYWSCLHYEDAADAIMTVCMDPPFPGLPAVYNVTDGEEWDLLRVAGIVANEAQDEVDVEVDTPPDFKRCRLSGENLKSRYPSLQFNTSDRIIRMARFFQNKK